MRVEPYGIDSYLHVIKRGARGMPIIREESDRWRFLRMLYLLNDDHFHKDWIYLKNNKPLFFRPAAWPPREPLVEIHAYTLLSNHFHLILRECKEGGISKFMQKLGQSMTNYFNTKYEEQGSLFQGSFRAKTINSDEYLKYVGTYVMVKNTFELFPHGGLKAAQQKFETAWQWAVDYNFSSLGDYCGVRQISPIVTKGLLHEHMARPDFKSFARDVILSGKWIDKEKELELYTSQTGI